MPVPRLADKVVLITGATGMAAATAVAAAEEGASVFVMSLSGDECRSLCAAVRDAAGGTDHACDWAQADVTDEAAVAAAVARCAERYGRIDALFNVAGISGRRLGDGPVHACSTGGWRATLDTNLTGAFLTCRAALSVMMAQPPAENDGGRGAILNMSSVLAFSPRADHFATHAYAASKGAVISLTQAMASYYAAHKIRVNAIAPALVRTPMSRRAQDDPQVIDLLKAKQPLLGDFIAADDVADAAIFLLSDEARAITGMTMTVDAGWAVTG